VHDGRASRESAAAVYGVEFSLRLVALQFQPLSVGCDQRAESRKQRGAVKRFAEENGCTRPQRPTLHAFAVKDCQNSYRHRRVTWQCSDLLACLDPVQLRHAQVEQHKRRQRLRGKFHSLEPIDSQQNGPFGLLQRSAEQAAHHRVVICNDHGFIEELDRQDRLR